MDPKYHIGYTYYLLQDYPTAEVYFREALAINPQHAWSAYWLARCLYPMGKRDEASCSAWASAPPARRGSLPPCSAWVSAPLLGVGL